MKKPTKKNQHPIDLDLDLLSQITGGTFPHLSQAADPPTEITGDPPSELTAIAIHFTRPTR